MKTLLSRMAHTYTYKPIHSLLLFLLLLPTAATAQRDYTADSIAFVNADWHPDTLNGFHFLYHHFMHRQVFNSNQCFSIIEIPSGSPLRLGFVADSGLTTVSNIATRHGALAAINGSYFDMRTGVPVCYLRIEGTELGINTPARRDSINRKYYQYATIRLTPTRKPRFLVPDSNRMAERSLKDSNLMTAGPMLIRKGIDIPQRMDRHFVYGRHNRTAIGLKPDGTVVLLVADGRHSREAEGLSLAEAHPRHAMAWLLRRRQSGRRRLLNHVHQRPRQRRHRKPPLGQRPFRHRGATPRSQRHRHHSCPQQEKFRNRQRK